MLVFRLRMWFSSLGRTISPARREQERLRVEQEEQVAMARLAAMFETRIEVPALAALGAPPAHGADQPGSFAEARPRVVQKGQGDACAKDLSGLSRDGPKTARSCVYCRYDFVLAESAWPLNGIAAAKVA